MLKQDIIEYIEKQILPVYEKNDSGHGLDHIKYVLERSLRFAKTIPDINTNMVYVIAAFHDIGHHIDAKNHEKVSAEMLKNDKFIQSYFSKYEVETMVEAIIDHRASLEYTPRSIYGKIISSADRNTSVEDIIRRTYSYCKKNYPNLTLEEMIDESRQHIIDKFGKDGYANNKMFFKDLNFDKMLSKIDSYVENKELFKKEFKKVNNIK